MKSLLTETKYLVPKVQLKKAEVSELVRKAEELIEAQEAFWNLYKVWIQRRVHTTFEDDGMRKLQTVFPEEKLLLPEVSCMVMTDIELLQDMTFLGGTNKYHQAFLLAK